MRPSISIRGSVRPYVRLSGFQKNCDLSPGKYCGVYWSITDPLWDSSWYARPGWYFLDAPSLLSIPPYVRRLAIWHKPQKSSWLTPGSQNVQRSGMDRLRNASDESPGWFSLLYSLIPMKWFHNRRMCDKRSSFLISFHFFRVPKLYDSSSVKTLRHVRTVFSFFGPHDLCRLLRFSVHGFSIFWYKYSRALK